MKKDLDYYLENISIEIEPDLEFSDLTGWYPVSNEDGIIAYFGREEDALRFRLDYINQLLNPIRI